MTGSVFAYEDDLLKHHIRKNVWLPLCLERHKSLNEGIKADRRRRLKYFTFCAIGAIDVFMLLLEKVIKKSKQDRFDTVVFFERDELAVIETEKRIPGATGFPGDFVEIVIMEDPGNPDEDALDAPNDQEDSLVVRDQKRKLAQRRQFVECFPFDVINLDLQDFLFKPKDEIPGKLINAMRNIFEWQKLAVHKRNGARSTNRLTEFSFMFTTRIGPPNMTDTYKEMLIACLESNIARDPELGGQLTERFGTADPRQVLAGSFEAFFKVAMPKILVSLVDEGDWYVDPNSGVKIFEFERHDGNGPYKMLHLVANIKRKIPPAEKRAPGTSSAVAQAAYRTVVQRIVSVPEVTVTLDTVDENDLNAHLGKIKSLRAEHYSG